MKNSKINKLKNVWAHQRFSTQPLKFLIAAIFSVTDCKELKLAQTALINLIGIYGYIFYELNRVLMRKNVNSEVTMNPPIQHHTYPDEHAPAAAYDRILPFL